MAKVQKSESESSPRSVVIKSGNLESLLLQLQKHLQWTSENPNSDLREIKRFVEEASAQLELPVQSLFLAEGLSNKMLKDETATEPTIAGRAEDLDQPARSSELDKLLIGLVDHPEAWLSTPSAHFAGRKPRDLVGTDEECKLFDLLRAVDQGLF